MTSLRETLADAYWEHWRKALRDNPRDGLPAYLDRLIEVFQEHAAEPVTVKRADDVPSDAEIERWILANPDQAMAIGLRKSVRVNSGGDVQRALGAEPKPVRAARKPRGGAAT